MTRVWLPGRPRLIAAWRTANRRRPHERPRGTDQQHDSRRTATAPPRPARPTRRGPRCTEFACQMATSASRTATAAPAAQLRQSRLPRRARTSARGAGAAASPPESRAAARARTAATPARRRPCPARRPTPVTATRVTPSGVEHRRRNRGQRGRRDRRARARCRRRPGPRSGAARSPARSPPGAPRHLSTATLLIFCCTMTRVTLHTPSPPSTTMANPTRLR